jgi:uncharacterized BrkB/YihY/UPF0761 family membrane protein
MGILVLAVFTSVLANPDALGAELAPTAGWLIRIAGFLLTVVVFTSLFRLLSLRRAGIRSVFPGAVVTAVLWQGLQLIGNSYVQGVINKANQTNKTFALVLGLMAFLYVASIIIVLGLEVNVVLRRRLYPRALLTPFTDNVILTAADQKAYSAYAKAQRHKGFESVEVTFEERGPDTGTHTIVDDPPAASPPAVRDH